jgi:phage pi2 protein 07
MSKIHKTFCVICEGKSEVAYIQEFRRLLRELGISSNILPYSVGTGHYVEVVRKYRQVCKERRKDKIDSFIIWVDADVYKRNEQKNQTKYSKKQKYIPNFKFNTYNFEDFLVMHLPKEEVAKWEKICSDAGHFITPMHSDVYLPLLCKSILPTYCKGELPIVVCNISLTNLRANQSDSSIPFKSDFADFLLGLLL